MRLLIVVQNVRDQLSSRRGWSGLSYGNSNIDIQNIVTSAIDNRVGDG